MGINHTMPGISKFVFGAFFCLSVLNPAGATKWSQAQIEKKVESAESTVIKAYNLLWSVREDNDMADLERDSSRTGLIGVEWTPLTTTVGYQNSKQLSTRAGWAGWLVREMAKHGIWEGADIAVTFTGSFPALNLAVLAALQEFNADVKGISSIGASSFGANEIGMSWPEMERLLVEEGILKKGCSAVTLGGTGDRGLEWDEYAMNLALRAAKRSNLPLLKPKNLRDAVKKRMLFYGLPDDYYCYINVGGGQASLGGGLHQRFKRGGWYYDPMSRQGEPNGVVDRFLGAGIPCLNLLFLDELNRSKGIVKK